MKVVSGRVDRASEASHPKGQAVMLVEAVGIKGRKYWKQGLGYWLAQPKLAGYL